MKTTKQYELPDTAELMSSKDYQDRFVAEYLQLEIRTAKLESLVNKMMAAEDVNPREPDYEKFCGFKPTCSTELLYQQLQDMKRYLETLKVRAEIEDIDLEDLKVVSTKETVKANESSKGALIINGYVFEPAGDGKTYVSKDVVFDSAFNKNGANVYEGSDVQKALNEWFAENASEKIRGRYDIDLLSMTEIFGKTQEDGSKKFWQDEPYKRLPIFEDWHNRIKGRKGENHPAWWLTKSPYSGHADYVCIVSSNGNANGYTVSDGGGVAPCLRVKEQSAKQSDNPPAKKRGGARKGEKGAKDGN